MVFVKNLSCYLDETFIGWFPKTWDWNLDLSFLTRYPIRWVLSIVRDWLRVGSTFLLPNENTWVSTLSFPKWLLESLSARFVDDTWELTLVLMAFAWFPMTTVSGEALFPFEICIFLILIKILTFILPTKSFLAAFGLQSANFSLQLFYLAILFILNSFLNTAISCFEPLESSCNFLHCFYKVLLFWYLIGF